VSNVGDLGRRVSERRRELGLSIDTVATRAGMDPVYVESLESRSSSELSRAGLWRLAAALDTTVDVLTGGGAQAPPGRTDPAARPEVDVLGRDRCSSLVAPGGVGRVLFLEQRGPVALPVNFRMLDDDVVFRTASLPELTANLERGNVSFEVDHIDEALAEGWSVLISGPGHVVEEPAERRRMEELDIAPWAGGARDVFVRIVPEVVTGRLIRRR
jgi:hypothetical protein